MGKLPNRQHEQPNQLVLTMEKILESAYQSAINAKDSLQLVPNDSIASKIMSVCQCETNKAPIRYLVAALLAKTDNSKIDTRQPYPKLGDKSFPGRTIDETLVQPFIHKYTLPCNDTTAFLTPAFRTLETALTKPSFDKCRPKSVYYDMMDVLDYVETHPKESKNILIQLIKDLIDIKKQNDETLSQMVAKLSTGEKRELSSEEITTLLNQHLQCNGSSRLPVLMFAAAYQSVKHLICEENKPLLAHNAADKRTGAIGDLEIQLSNDDKTVTCYEMKEKRVSTDDIFVCIEKIEKLDTKPDNYIIITTEDISKEVKDLACSMYDKTGVEIAVLDCIGFINHFLHFFHRYRTSFLNHYQNLVLQEPTSSVSQPLKEAFLSLRNVAESI